MNVSMDTYTEAVNYAERMVRLWFRGQVQGSFDCEDALQEARIAVWNAAHSFDPSAGVPFRLYARQQALGYARNALRNWRGVGRGSVSPTLNVPVMPDPPCERPSPAETAVQRHFHHYLWRQVEQLEPMHATALTLRYREGQSRSEVSDAIGCHPAGLCRIERRALGALREMIGAG